MQRSRLASSLVVGAAIIAALAIPQTAHAAPATTEGPDGPYVVVDVEAWSDPTDQTETVYINIPEGACAVVDSRARQVRFVYDDTCN